MSTVVRRSTPQMRAIYAELRRRLEATERTAAICLPGKVADQWAVRVADQRAVCGCVEIAMGVAAERRSYRLEVKE